MFKAPTITDCNILNFITMIEIVKKKTLDISENEVHAIYQLFDDVFHKQRKTEDFYNQYRNTFKGYSYHALAIENGRIVGHNAYMPFQYLKDSLEPFMLVISVDAMIHADCRGKGIYRKMLHACEEMAIEEGCKIRVGFPNDNSYPVQINGFKYIDIGELSTYVLPTKISTLKPSLRLFDWLCILFSNTLSFLSRLPGGKMEHRYAYAKDRNTFDNYRYNWAKNKYKVVKLQDNGIARYCNEEYQGKYATFIMDVFPLTRNNFDRAVRQIKKTNPEAGLFLYVGNLPFTPLSMVKIPKILAPKKFHFVGKILDPKFFTPNDVIKIENWELNLSNYDLL